MHTSNNDFCAPGEPTALHGTHLTLLNLKFLNFSFFCSFVTGSQNSLPGVQIRTLIGNSGLDARTRLNSNSIWNRVWIRKAVR